MQSKYDSKIANHNKSADTRRLKRIRVLVIAGWLMVSVVVGLLIYNNYAKDRMSDTPIAAVTIEDGVSTGTKLLDNVDFGPWNGSKLDINE